MNFIILILMAGFYCLALAFTPSPDDQVYHVLFAIYLVGAAIVSQLDKR